MFLKVLAWYSMYVEMLIKNVLYTKQLQSMEGSGVCQTKSNRLPNGFVRDFECIIKDLNADLQYFIMQVGNNLEDVK